MNSREDSSTKIYTAIANANYLNVNNYYLSWSSNLMYITNYCKICFGVFFPKNYQLCMYLRFTVLVIFLYSFYIQIFLFLIFEVFSYSCLNTKINQFQMSNLNYLTVRAGNSTMSPVYTYRTVFNIFQDIKHNHLALCLSLVFIDMPETKKGKLIEIKQQHL